VGILAKLNSPLGLVEVLEVSYGKLFSTSLTVTLSSPFEPVESVTFPVIPVVWAFTDTDAVMTRRRSNSFFINMFEMRNTKIFVNNLFFDLLNNRRQCLKKIAPGSVISIKRQIYRFGGGSCPCYWVNCFFAGFIVNCLTLEQVCKRVVSIAFRLIQNLTGLIALNS
jgi:hypothetical protein